MVKQLAAVAVGAHPHNIAIGVGAKLTPQPLTQNVLSAHIGGIGVRRHLVVNAPNIVGHQVLPHGAVIVEGGFNPGVAFGRRLLLETHIGDAPAIVSFDARHRYRAPLVKRCVAAGGIDDVMCPKGIGAFWGLHI